MAVVAGDLDRRIVIERNGGGQDTLGNDVDGWATLATRWAKVTYGSGVERREAAKDNAAQPATFEVRRDAVTATVTPAERIRWDGLIWNIVGAARLGRDGMAFTAVAQEAGGPA